MADGLRYRIAAGSCALLALTWPASAAEGPPKRGGTLTYLIPVDSPPSFDGHREGTFAMVHATAPFYSTLIRISPDNPSDRPQSTALCRPGSDIAEVLSEGIETGEPSSLRETKMTTWRSLSNDHEENRERKDCP